MEKEKKKKKKNPIKPRSVETDIIVKALENLEEGEIITYKEMSSLVGDPLDGAYPQLRSARRIIETEHMFHLTTITRVGVKRATPDECVVDMRKGMRKVRRQNRRIAHIGHMTDREELTSDARRDYDTQMTLAGVLEVFTKPSNVKRIKDKATKEGSTLPNAKCLSIFLKKKKRDGEDDETPY